MYHAKYTPNKSLYAYFVHVIQMCMPLMSSSVISAVIIISHIIMCIGYWGFFCFYFYFSSFFFIMFSVSYDPDISFIYVNIRFGLKGAVQTLNLRFLQF